MKKFTTTILIMTIGFMFNAFAGHRGSTLRLTLPGHAPYMVRLNNGWSAYAERVVAFDNLEPGYHQITVSRPSAYYGGRIVFQGSVFVPASSEVTARLERGGYLTVIATREIYPVYAPVPVPVPAPVIHEEPVVCSTPVSYPVYQHPGTYNYPVSYGPVMVPVCQDEFISIRNAIAGTVFESTRMEIARQLIRDRYLTTSQVMSLMELFDFDSNRLDFAKFAYNRTVDRDRYHQVYSMFTFDSNVRELSRYINSCS